jgi:galactoside O-acetyltransferase
LIGLIARGTRRIDVGERSRVNWLRIGAKNGRLTIGARSMVKCRIDFDHPSGEVRIGDGTYIGRSHLVCHTRIDVGHDVIMSWGITILDHDSHSLDWRTRYGDVSRWIAGEKLWRDVAIQPVTIGNHVWIGFGATILKGVHVGDGAVIAACSVVTKDVAPYTLVAGNPARPIRQLRP